MGNKAKENIEKIFPKIKIIGYHDGYIEGEKEKEIIEEINKLQPNVLFVAMGHPKQEKWIYKHRKELKVDVAAGQGGTFDYEAGRIRRAPVVFQKLGIEWFWRLLMQPSRIVRMMALPVYLLKIVFTKDITKDNVAIGDKINIIKDQFLKDAVIVKGNLSGTSFTEDQTNGKYYIKFTFELSIDNDITGEEDSTKEIYLDASSLVNVDEITQVKKVEDFEDSTISALGLTVDTLLFKENGETRIYNAEIGDLIDCSEETVASIDETTDLNLIPTVGAIRDYVDEIKATAGAGSIEKVTAISEGPSDKTKDTLLFTATGETGIWDASEQTLVDISEESTSSITDTTADTLLPNVGAVKGYFATFDAELAELKTQFDALKSLIS